MMNFQDIMKAGFGNNNVDGPGDTSVTNGQFTIHEMRMGKIYAPQSLMNWIKEHSQGLKSGGEFLVVNVAKTVREKLPVPQHYQGDEEIMAGQFLDILEMAHRYDFDLLWFFSLDSLI